MATKKRKGRKKEKSGAGLARSSLFAFICASFAFFAAIFFRDRRIAVPLSIVEKRGTIPSWQRSQSSSRKPALKRSRTHRRGYRPQSRRTVHRNVVDRVAALGRMARRSASSQSGHPHRRSYERNRSFPDATAHDFICSIHCCASEALRRAFASWMSRVLFVTSRRAFAS